MAGLMINDVPAACIIQAARQYYVPVSMVIAILKAENGRVGQANPNKNGTVDYGPMQINSIWVKKVERYGYTAHDLQYDPCANVQVGAWILAQQIANGRDLWTGVADYHSHTWYENHKYGSRVSQYYYQMQQALSSPE